jgi:hypothetical protein
MIKKWGGIEDFLACRSDKANFFNRALKPLTLGPKIKGRNPKFWILGGQVPKNLTQKVPKIQDPALIELIKPDFGHT